MTLSPVRNSASLVDQICLRLGRQLSRGLKTGDDKLPPEREMARQLGVSRAVLREATKRLELQGLLEIRHGSGIRAVSRLHKPLNGSLSLLLPEVPERFRQLTEARAIVEPEIARRAAQQAGKTDVERLQRLHEAMKAATTREEAVEADIEFHREIADMGGNEVLKLILDSLADLGRESRQVTIGKVGKERAIEHHAAILAAIAAHDGAAAAQAMRYHLDEAGRDLTTNPRAKR